MILTSNSRKTPYKTRYSSLLGEPTSHVSSMVQYYPIFEFKSKGFAFSFIQKPRTDRDSVVYLYIMDLLFLSEC